MVFARSMWLLGLIYFLGLGLLFGLNFGESLKVPFSVNDVLPALPRQISWPVLNNLHSAVDLLPSLVGSVSPTNGSIEWKGAFFFDNEARLEFTGGNRGLGGGVLHLKGGNVGHLHKLLGIESSSQRLSLLALPYQKQVSGPSSPEFKRGFSIGIGTILRRAASVVSVAAKHAYAAAASTQGSNEEMLPLKCCLMSVDDKCQYSCDDKDNRVHGWICSNPAVGFWMITPSDELRTGGPVKQDLTSHIGPTTLSMFFSTHYAGDNLTIKLRDGEPWKKVFGPVLIYLNSVSVEEDALTLWEDAKEQMLIETQSWPYDFPLSEDFPHVDQRGTVSGRLLVRDKYINEQLMTANFAMSSNC